MALIKQTLEANLYSGLLDIYLQRAGKGSGGDEQEDPKVVCDKLAKDIANVVATAIDAYVRSGDIYINGSNVIVVSPMGPCTVTPGTPAKVM